MGNNFQVILYYVKKVPPKGGLPGEPYQGQIIKLVPAQPGYIPDEADVIEYAPVGVDTAFSVFFSLN